MQRKPFVPTSIFPSISKTLELAAMCSVELNTRGRPQVTQEEDSGAGVPFWLHRATVAHRQLRSGSNLATAATRGHCVHSKISSFYTLNPSLRVGPTSEDTTDLLAAVPHDFAFSVPIQANVEISRQSLLAGS